MFTLIGAIVGFVAMLAARGRAGIAAGLSMLGLLLGAVYSVVFVFEQAPTDAESAESFADRMLNIDWSTSNWIALGCAALPGVAGALFARRD